MIRIAIVDDDARYRSEVEGYIARYGKETGEEFEVTCFQSGMDFITDYKPVNDIVFLDIEMPLIDGMSTARKLRLVDKEICIVFITKMSKYALEGYEVNAVDFVVKPIKYFNFTDKLKKAIANEPETVIEFFKKLSNNLYDKLTEKMARTDYSSAFTIYNDTQMDIELKSYDSKIAKEQDKLNDYIDRWYKKFSQMEVALSKLNSQESSISSLFG